MVGADDWAIELNAEELADFCRLLLQLVENMRLIQSELMDEENIDCEAESDLLWMQVSGLPSKYNLRLILSTGRGCEGNWGAEALPELIGAVQSLEVF